MSDLVDHPDFETTDMSRVKLMNANFAVQPPEIGEKMKKALPNAVFVGMYRSMRGTCPLNWLTWWKTPTSRCC